MSLSITEITAPEWGRVLEQIKRSPRERPLIFCVEESIIYLKKAIQEQNFFKVSLSSRLFPKDMIAAFDVEFRDIPVFLGKASGIERVVYRFRLEVGR